MNARSTSRCRTRAGTLLLALATAACGSDGPRSAAADTTPSGADSMAFRNALTDPPAGWTGPVFKLSYDYPDAAPAACTTCPWLTMDVDFGSTDWAVWQPYLDSVLAYAVQGQTEHLRHETGWLTQVNGATRWFHVPWMAYDPKSGREFIHGTTNERTAHRSDFVGVGRNRRELARPRLLVGVNTLPGAIGSDSLFETWAVGMYNDYGAWAIGQAVPPSGVPAARDTAGTQAMPVRFPEGTVVVKLLFTTATPRQVPYLHRAPRWQVDRHVWSAAADSFLWQRRPQEVHLVQMDLSVRDHRSPIGWVYGTYAYNGRQPGTAWWQRLTPVGVQWGNDTLTWPAVDSAASQPIAESSLNHGITIPEHEGCNGRLAGPVDNKLSACTACHGAAYVPSPVGTVGSDSNTVFPFYFSSMCAKADSFNAAYFSNVVFPAKYPAFPGVSGPVINLDTSLQLWVAYRAYATWLASKPSASP